MIGLYLIHGAPDIYFTPFISLGQIMRYGVHSWLWTTRFREENLILFDKVYRMGYDGIEIHLEHLELLPISGIKRKMHETGLSCTFSVGLTEDKNVSSPFKAIRERGINFLKEAIEIVAELEGDVICGVMYAAWGGANPMMRKFEEYKHAIESLQILANHAEKHGIVLALEPIHRFTGHMINTADEMAAFIAEINHKNVKMLLDTFHMNIEENNLCEPFKKYSHLVYHVHLNENHRGMPGTGTMPWKEIFKTLKEIGYNRWLVYETFSHDVLLKEFGYVPRNIAMWRRLITDSDYVAQQALNFFKEIENMI